jgi:hypothetical protein
MASLLGGSANFSGNVGLSNSLLNDWVTYNQNANTTPSAATQQSVLNATA